MTLTDILNALKDIDPVFSYHKAKALDAELEWWRANDKLKTDMITSLLTDLEYVKQLAMGIPITAPKQSKAISSALTIAPILYAHPTISKSYLGIWGGEYQATTITEMMRFVQTARINTLPYLPNLHECAKFAYGLMGAFYNTRDWWDTPIAVIESAGHVQNIIFAFEDEAMSNLKAWILEPQDNSLHSLGIITGIVSCVLMG